MDIMTGDSVFITTIVMACSVAIILTFSPAQSVAVTPLLAEQISSEQKSGPDNDRHDLRKLEQFNGARVAAGEVIVRFNKPLGKKFLSLLSKQTLTADFSVREIGGGLNLYCLHFEGLSTSKLLKIFGDLFSKSKAEVDENPVMYFEPNYLMELEQRTPNDLTFGSETLWALRDYSGGRPGISAISAWDTTTGSTGVVVGMVDSGIDSDHPDLKCNLWRAPYAFRVKVGDHYIACPKDSYGFNVQPGDGEGSCSPDDGDGHGTNVAGIIGAEGNNGEGIVGVNWKPMLLGLRFTNRAGSGFACDAIDAIEFAIQLKALYERTKDERFNIRVLNNSYGYTCTSEVDCPLKSMRDVIERANGAGITFVTSAGNVSSDNDTNRHFPSGYFFLPNVISVASTDSQDELSAYSNYGDSSVHLGAPGTKILTTWNWLDQKYKHQSGTSMAAAFVSGAAALVLSYPKCESLKPSSIKTTLITSVDKVKPLSGKVITGGRLNVYRAIRTCRP